MKEKFIKKLYNFWNKTDDNKEKLLEEITENVNSGRDGAEVLLDWCRCDYDYVRDTYKNLHNLNDTQMEELLEEHFGNYEFMYEEIPYVEDLDEIWNICNWYLDYCNDEMGEDTFYSLSNLGSVEL